MIGIDASRPRFRLELGSPRSCEICGLRCLFLGVALMSSVFHVTSVTTSVGRGRGVR